MTPKWFRREQAEIVKERAAVYAERSAGRDLLHQAADLVMAIQEAAERMERIIGELAEEEVSVDEGNPGGGEGRDDQPA